MHKYHRILPAIWSRKKFSGKGCPFSSKKFSVALSGDTPENILTQSSTVTWNPPVNMANWASMCHLMSKVVDLHTSCKSFNLPLFQKSLRVYKYTITVPYYHVVSTQWNRFSAIYASIIHGGAKCIDDGRITATWNENDWKECKLQWHLHNKDGSVQLEIMNSVSCWCWKDYFVFFRYRYYTSIYTIYDYVIAVISYGMVFLCVILTTFIYTSILLLLFPRPLKALPILCTPFWL